MAPSLSLQVSSWHTRTHQNEDVPHAAEEELKKQFEKYEKLFTITPQRLRKIVESFVETLEKGLEEPDQVVVSDHTAERSRARHSDD